MGESFWEQLSTSYSDWHMLWLGITPITGFPNPNQYWLQPNTNGGENNCIRVGRDTPVTFLGGHCSQPVLPTWCPALLAQPELGMIGALDKELNPNLTAKLGAR